MSTGPPPPPPPSLGHLHGHGADEPKRPRNAPRVVDYAKPVLVSTDRIEADRPGAAAPRIKPEAIVPAEDSPVRGWKAIGFHNLSNVILPEDARHNPVAAYLANRGKGYRLEEFLAVIPWLLATALPLLVLWLGPPAAQSAFNRLVVVTLVEIPVVGALLALLASIHTGHHVRRNLTRVPLEELLLTRLSVLQVIQGLFIRPHVTQLACLIWSQLLVLLGVSIWALKHEFGPVAIPVYIMTLLLLKFLWWRAQLDMAVALNVRANLCIRSPGAAGLRATMDVSVGLLVSTLILLGLYLAATVSIAVTGFLGLMCLEVVVLAIIIGVGYYAQSIQRTILEDTASSALAFCYNNPDDWWAIAMHRGDDGDTGRSVRTPWKPMRELRAQSGWKASRAEIARARERIAARRKGQ